MVEDLLKSEEAINNEKDEVIKIMEYIDTFKSFVLKAGAGSGKTYSLVQTILSILDNESVQLTQNSQKILCITYTNVAANEIKNRIGNTSLVKVSTIHDFLWETINNYQSQLIKEHIKKINSTLIQNNSDLSNSDYSKIPIKKQQELNEVLTKNKQKYYNIRNLNADAFRESLTVEFKSQFKELLSNVNKFKKIANKILFNNSLQITLDKIEEQEEGYQYVVYNTNINMDRLSRMEISHNTLLEYSNNLFEQYKLLCMVIIDRYPYILIDEYQDTNPLVIELLGVLESYKKTMKKEFVIGFFGDEAQSIYDTGIGNQLPKVFKDLKVIQKKYNYRSSDAVIKFANFTRLDNLNQSSAFKNNISGEVNFILTNEIEDKWQKTANEVIEIYKRKWKIDKDNNMGIFLTLNKYLSEINNFSELYNFFNSAPYYKVYWDQLNQDTLSKELINLGRAQIKLYDMLNFRNKLNDENMNISELITDEVLKLVTYTELKNIIKKLMDLKETKTLSDFIKKSFSLINNTVQMEEKNKLSHILSKHFKMNTSAEFTYENFVGSLVEPLILDRTTEEASDRLLNKFNKLLEEPIALFVNWYQYINSERDEDINYSTIHNTKGNEYDNVIVVLEKDFGKKNKNYFNRAITNIVERTVLNSTINLNEVLATNLLYVASTRARKNMVIVYFDDSFVDENSRIKGNVDNYYDNIKDIE